ncbi:MAG: DUF389 domain-containing protein [Haloarculaceae archaeon]
MRLIHVLVPGDAREAVLGMLDEEGIDYVVISEAQGADSAIVQFPVPTSAVQDVLDALAEAGLNKEYVVVNSVETAHTRNLEALDTRFGEGPYEEIASDEIRSRAAEMSQGTITYFAMTLLSVVVATAGLLLDSAAVVVGSMVIAPQVGSALQVSVGVVLRDREMLREGFLAQVLGLAAAVVAASAFGWLLVQFGVVSPTLSIGGIDQVSQRVSPGVFSVAIAVAAGLAAAFSLGTAVPTSLVGVTIAAALVPAAAATGIGVAWARPAVALGGLLLLALNVTVINLTAIAGLLVMGYRPELQNLEADTGFVQRQGWPIVAAVLVLAAVLLSAGSLTAQYVALEHATSETVQDVLARPAYERTDLVGVQVEFGAGSIPDTHRHVTVVVARPPRTTYPRLAERIRRRLTERIGGPVVVEVEYRERETAAGGVDARSVQGAMRPRPAGAGGHAASVG